MAARQPRLCSFQDCAKKHDSHGYCNHHANQYRKYGRPQTKEDVHSRLSKIRQGQKQCLGKTWKVKDTSKMKGHHPKSEFKKGNSTMLGKPNPAARNNPQTFKKGHAAWNKVGDGITPLSKLERKRFQQTTQALVFQRDDYTCQMCEQHGGYLQVDHIKRWADYPELRFNLDNCRTLCMACHYYLTFKRKLPQGVVWGHNLSKRIES